MATGSQDQKFQIQRRRLTKFWLGLLLFNILLNVDAVENYIESLSEKSPRWVVSQLICTNTLNIQAPSEEQKAF